jgi:transposase
VVRIAPADTLQKIACLAGCQRYFAIDRCGPDKPFLIQPLGVEQQAKTVMPQRLDQRAAPATEDELAAAAAATKTTTVAAFTRNQPARKPFPEHLPRKRVVVPGPTTCACCSGARLRKLGEDMTETLEVIPRQWKVIQHVREKFSCRDREKISQTPAPLHVIARGWAGHSRLASSG